MSLLSARCGNYTLRIKDPNNLAGFSDLTPRIGPIKLQWGESGGGKTGGILASSSTILIEDTVDHKIRSLFDSDFTEANFPVEISGPFGESAGGTWHGFVKRTKRHRPTSFTTSPRALELEVHDGLTRLKNEERGDIAGRKWDAIMTELSLIQDRSIRFNFGVYVAEGETVLMTHEEMRRYCEYPSTANSPGSKAWDHLKDLAERLHLQVWMEPLTERWEVCHIRAVGQDRESGLFVPGGGWSDVVDGKKQRSVPLEHITDSKNAYETAILTSIDAKDERTTYIHDSNFNYVVSSGDFTYWVELGDVTEPSGNGVYLGVGSDGVQAGTVYQEMIHKGKGTIDLRLTWTSTDQSTDDSGTLTVELQIMKDGEDTWTTLASTDGLINNIITATVTDKGRLRLWAKGENAYWDPEDPMALYEEGTTTDVEKIIYDQPAGVLTRSQDLTRDWTSVRNTIPGDVITRYDSQVSTRVYRSAFEHRARGHQLIHDQDTWVAQGLGVRGVHTPLVRLLLEQGILREQNEIPFVPLGGREVNLYDEFTTLNDISA